MGNRFNFHKARKAAASSRLGSLHGEHQQYRALIAEHAPILRKMTAAEVEHIAKDNARPASWRAAARGELQQRGKVAFNPKAPGFANHQNAYAREMRGMTTNDVRQIATDTKESAPLRALAWRELKWRENREPPRAGTRQQSADEPKPPEGLPWD